MSSGRPPRALIGLTPPAFAVLAGVILVLAAYLWGGAVGQGAPYVYHPDEPAVMVRAMRVVYSGDADPRWFRYPSLCIYLQAAVVAVGRWLTGIPIKPGLELLFEGARASVVRYYIWGRCLTVALALGTTLLTMAMVRRAGGAWVALLSGVLFATSPLAFESAVFVTVDMALTFFVALSVYLTIRFSDSAATPSKWALLPAIVAAALAAGAKYNGALVLLVVAGAYVARAGLTRPTVNVLLGYAGVAIVVFLLTTPYSVLDWAAFWSVKDGLPAELLHYRSGHLGADSGASGVKLLETVWKAVGPLAPLALFGVLPTRDAFPARVVLLSSIVVLAVPVATAKVFFPRNALPLIPGIIALACLSLRTITRRVASSSLPLVLRGAMLMAIVFFPAMAQARTRYHEVAARLSARRLQDPRTVAMNWALSNVPRGSRILREAFAPHVHLSDRFTVESVFSLGQLSPNAVVTGTDYVMTTSVMWGAFPDATKSGYEKLFARTPDFEAAPPPELVGMVEWPTVRIYRLKPLDPPDLESHLVFRLSETEGFVDVDPLGSTVLEVPPSGRQGPVEVNARDGDPAMLLPAVPGDAASRYLLRVDVEVPADTDVQVFYATEREPHFKEAASVRGAARTGRQVVDLRFGPARVTGRLRLDPGQRRGEYTVHAISLYRLPD